MRLPTLTLSNPVGWLLLGVFLLGALQAPGASAAQKEAVVWMKSHFPPWHILEGPFEGEGLSDGIEALLMADLPEYDHSVSASSFKRILHELKSGCNCCYSAMLKKPERLAFAYFSLPIILSPPNALIYLKKNNQIAANSRRVSFAKLLANPLLMFGHSSGRSYSPQIDTLLRQHEGQGNIHVLTRTDQTRKIFELLLHERIDYTIAYPFEASYAFAELGAEDQFTSVPLEEEQDYKLVYIACAKTPWGETLIQRINTVLQKKRATEAYRKLIERWLEPGSIDHYRRVYNEKLFGDALP